MEPFELNNLVNSERLSSAQPSSRGSPSAGLREPTRASLQGPRNTFTLPLGNINREAATGGCGRTGWTQSSCICRTDKAHSEDSGVRNPAAKPRSVPQHRAALHPPDTAAARSALREPSPAGRSLRRTIPGGDRHPRGRRRRLRPRFPARESRAAVVGGETGAPGRRRPVRPRVPRRALTQHKVAEAPGHALGQVVHIELHGVQRQRLLHGDGDAGAAAGTLADKVGRSFPPADRGEREERAVPVPVPGTAAPAVR